MAKEFNQIYAEAMQLSNNSEALMDNLTKAAMAAGKLTAETKKDLEVFKQLRETTKDISTQLAEAGKRNLTSEAVELQKINDKILAQQKRLNTVLEDRLKIEKDTSLSKEEKKEALRAANKEYETQLESLRKIERQEAQNAQKAKDRLRQLSREMDNLNSRASGTIFDPTVGFFHSTGAELKSFDNTFDYLEKKNQQLADSFGDALSGSIDSIQSRFDSFTRGSGNFLRDFASAARAAREGNKKKAEKGESVSRFQKVLGFMGKASGLIGMLGKLVTGFAGVFAAAFAVFKVMQAVEEKIKGVNKELVDAYGATDLMYEGMENTYEAINRARKELSDADFANSIGETLEGARSLVASLNEMGINARTTGGDFDAMKEIVTGMKASAVSLGTDFGTIAAYTQQFKEEMGYAVQDGELLEKMGDHFARIRDVAMQSSFSTNRFFTTIQNLTDGIEGMNTTVGETAKMFLNISKVLGPKAAQAFTQGLMGGFKGEGIQDRFKRLILMGGSKKIMQRTADRTVKRLEKQLTYSQRKILNEAGIKSLDKRDLAKVTDAELEKAMGELRRRGGPGGFKRADELMRSVRLARGGSGGLSDQALALGELDLSGNLSAQMQQLYAIQGDKGFQDITAIGMEKLAQMTGKSIEELEEMRKIDMAMRSDFAKVKEIQEMQDSQGNRLTPEAMNKVLKENGFEGKLQAKTIDGVTKVVDNQGNVIENVSDYIESNDKELDQMGKSQYNQLDLLTQVVEATMTSADLISNTIEAGIQTLNDPLSSLASYMIKDSNYEKKKQFRDNLRDQIGSKKDLISGVDAEIRKLKSDTEKELKNADPAKRAQIRQKALEREETLRLKKQKLIDDQADLNAQLRVAMSKEVTGDTPEKIKEQVEALSDERLSRTKEGRNLLRGKGRTEEEVNYTQIFDALRKGGFDVGTTAKPSAEAFQDLFGDGQDIDVYRQNVEAIETALKRGSGGDLSLFTNATAHGTSQNILESSIGDNVERALMSLVSTAVLSDMEKGGIKSAYKVRSKSRGANIAGAEAHDTYSDRTGLIAVDNLGVTASSHRRTMKKDEAPMTEEAREFQERQQKIREEGERKTLEQLALINTSISETTDPNIQKKLEQDKVDLIAKNKKLYDRDKKMNVEAILESKKQETEQALRSYDLLGDNSSLDNKGTLDSVIANLTAKMNSITDKDSAEYKELYEQRQNIRKYYAKDMESTPGMGKPLLYHNGYLVEGSANDSVSFTDRTKGGGGRGGMGGNVYNIIVPKGPAESQSLAIANGFRTAGHA